MGKRRVKSLYRTGRVSRKKARAVAARLRDELATGEIERPEGSRIGAKTTASGRNAIAFHVVSSEPELARSRAAGKARKGTR